MRTATIGALVLVCLGCGRGEALSATRPSTESDTSRRVRAGAAEEQGKFQLSLVETLQHADGTCKEISAIAESPDGRFLAWGDIDGMVRVHSFDQKQTRTASDFPGADCVQDLAFDDEGHLWWAHLLADVWRMKLPVGEGLAIKVVDGSGSVPRSSLLPGALVVVKGKSLFQWKHILRLHDLSTGEAHESELIFPQQRGINELVQHLARSPDGKLLLAVADGDAALLSLPEMKILRRLDRRWGYGAAFSPDSRLIALGTRGHGLFVSEVRTGKKIGKYHSGAVAEHISSVVFVNNHVLYASDLPIFRIDLRTGSMDRAAEQVNAKVLLLSRSGDRLFAGTHEGAVHIYQLPAVDHPPPKE